MIKEKINKYVKKNKLVHTKTIVELKMKYINTSSVAKIKVLITASITINYIMMNDIHKIARFQSIYHIRQNVVWMRH